MQEYSNKGLLVRYFLHGVLFALISLTVIILWGGSFYVIFLLMALLHVSYLINLAIGLISYLFIMGGLNVLLTGVIWRLEIKSDWKNLLLHGFVLFILQFTVYTLAVAAVQAVPNLTMTIALFIICPLIMGFLARRIADWWEE